MTDINQFRTARRKMEGSIGDAVAAALLVFRESTGMSPRGIQVELVDVSEVGEIEARYCLGTVRADVPL
jgi:hypothetical protein